MTDQNLSPITVDEIKNNLLNKKEIALIDLREEADFALNHPLFAANISLTKLEIEILDRIPRFDTKIVLYGYDFEDVKLAAKRLNHLGYQNLFYLENGIEGWKNAGGELFQDVNVPSKAFGELVESIKHTPSLSASEVKKLLDKKAKIRIFDVRRFDEYQTMNIPGSTSVPNGELILRLPALVPDDQTQIIINCAGRTRSIIGTQTLVNAGYQNVNALRNGTIGWTLEKFSLDHGQSASYPEVDEYIKQFASQQSKTIADKAGVQRIDLLTTQQWLLNNNDHTRTTYLFDIRSEEEYKQGHLSGSRHIPGGQLVQETDHYASVRGARIVLVDSSGTARANITASWLTQMGWEVYVIDGLTEKDFNQTGHWQANIASVPEIPEISPEALNNLIQENKPVLILDVTASANYVKQHIPTAKYVLRGHITKHIHNLKNLDQYQQIVLTCGTSLLARFAAHDLAQTISLPLPISVLSGGNQAWFAQGYAVSTDNELLSPRVDRYIRPYEGTSIHPETMQAYLDWEYGLVGQLAKDGTHHFSVI